VPFSLLRGRQARALGPRAGRSGFCPEAGPLRLQFLIDSNTSVWFAKLTVVGELAIGVGLIVGAFVGWRPSSAP
jgi:hypothetical protein